MQIYLVGGAVRDTLLGLPVKDRDWVVVGATPQGLIARGFTPVGRDFPVFLHPQTHDQYALARTERKTAPGYQGFVVHAAPDVSLEQDLARRDLSINAIAVDAAQTDAEGNFDPARATLVDPFQGREDLARRRLRHVTDAFREDPVRILRVARFAARFADFHVAHDTLQLMRDMVAHGEAAALVAERVWQEMARGLMEATPSRLFTVLQDCGAFEVVLPELSDATRGAGAHVLHMLDHCAAQHASLEVRFACLCLYAHPVSAPPVPRDAHPIRQLCARLRVPADCTALAELAARERIALQDCTRLDARGLVDLLERCDAFRKPARVAELMQVMACDARKGSATDAYPPRDALLTALAAARAVVTESVAAQAQAGGLAGQAIGLQIREARVRAVAAVLAPAEDRRWAP
jgi:tRNA nucleotidyltransferase (CCA-adding enzyme)